MKIRHSPYPDAQGVLAAAKLALAVAMLHFVYGLYLGYSGDFDFSPTIAFGFVLPSALSPAFFLALGGFLVSFAIDLARRAPVIHRRACWGTLIMAGMIGWLAGGFMVDAALDHNPQGAFYDPARGIVAYGYLSAIFYGWFLCVFLPITLISLGLQLVLGWTRQRSCPPGLQQ
ncbi:MAG TPA: hypothetical protein VND94_23190 [Terriglobia bacterium]|nr:hypothetical protein [Terriglobia bacterium]